MLSAVVWGSVYAAPLDKALVVAQAPTYFRLPACLGD